MKLCYSDESGHGEGPILVAAGVILDASRMHITKNEWNELIDALSRRTGRPIHEFKTRHFYKGKDAWHTLSGDERSAVIDGVIDWVKDRKHKIAFTAVDKPRLNSLSEDDLPEGFPTSMPSEWTIACLHLALGIQKEHQRIAKNKGHTIMVFDKQVMEESAFIALLRAAPGWTETFYGRKKKQDSFDQIVDVPFFADSTHIGLLQAADLFAYLLRQFAEVTDGHRAPAYADEPAKLGAWAKKIADLALPRSSRWVSKSPCPCASFFNAIAPPSLKVLG